nr:hypothetical protein CFP56_44576 [Quercus suber]
MKLYWKKVMSTFEGYVKSREVDEVVISPPLREISLNAQLIPNTKAASAWAARQNLGFVEWRADLNGWVVHGGDVPVEWSEKNIIAKAPKSNPAIGASKRPCVKSPSSEDKPKKVTKSNAPADAPVNSLSPTKHYRRRTNAGRVEILETLEESGEEMQSEGHDSEGTTADFGKLLFLTSVSSRVSSADILCSLGPIDEDIEMASESPTAAVTTGEAAAGESSEESVGKDLDVTITVGEAVAGVPSQGEVVSPTIHDAHHDKETPESRGESSSGAAKGMSLEEFLERFAEDEENEKVSTDFHPLSNDTVIFQRSKISRTKLDDSNLHRVLEWKNALKDLLFMKFRVQFILDKIRAAIEACITRDDEFSRKIVDLEREIATKRVELALLLSQRDALTQSSSAGGVSSSEGTFSDGLFD